MLYSYTLETPAENLCPITAQVQGAVADSGITDGICVVYCPHTTAGITINENADPDVRTDMTKIHDRLIKENEPYYDHVLEGADDMPAHAKCSLTGVSLNIPISKGKLNLGTWQGIYLCEFRDHGGRRKLTATIIGE